MTCSDGKRLQSVEEPLDVQAHLVAACMAELLVSKGKACSPVLQGQTQLVDAVTQDIQLAAEQQPLVPVVPFTQQCSGHS